MAAKTKKPTNTRKTTPAMQPEVAMSKVAMTKVALTKASAAGEPLRVKAAKAKGLSMVQAAGKVLAEKGEPMTCREMIEAMAEKGYWKSPGGLTPHATLYSAILRLIQRDGKQAPFKKEARGLFALNPSASA
jgi:hypothetical protein